MPQQSISVPFLDIHAQLAPIRQQIIDAVTSVIDRGQFILGSEVAALESEVAALSHCQHGIGCASGSDALILALRGLNVGPGDEVVVPTFTFFATAGAVCNVGATPVFADIDPHTLNITRATIEPMLTEKTKAIIAVHLYGQCCDMDPILALAKERNLLVIEDAAQAIGATYHGRPAGSMGDVGCLSFFPSKNLGGFGDGGMVLVPTDQEVADRVRLLRQHGAQPKYYHQVIGINSRLDEIQAAVLRVKLPHLSAWSAARRGVATGYLMMLDEVPIQLPATILGAKHIYHQFTVVTRDRRALAAYLAERGIGTAVYYPLCLHQQACFAHFPSAHQSLPVAEVAAFSVLSLPVYPELRPDQQEIVTNSIASYFR